MKVTLLIVTLNEIQGMREIMPKIKKEWYNQLVILDGNSTDGTLEYARENGYFTIVQKKKGIRNGYVEVWPHIKGDVVITFSPDGNSIPEIIPALVKKIKEGYDMVIVSRYLENAKSDDDDVITSFGNWMFTSLINLLFRGHYTDAMVIYRAYKKDLVYKLELDKDFGYSFVEKMFFTRISWEPLLSMRCAKSKFKYSEISGDEPVRIGGERKLQIIRWGCAFLAQAFLEVFAKRKGEKS